MIRVYKFTFNGFQENTYVLADDLNNCVIIDPGCYERHEERELTEFIREHELNVLALLNTHAHIDHILGNQFVLQTYPVDHYLHEKDIETLERVDSYAALYGFGGYKSSPLPTKVLQGGEDLVFGRIRLQVYHTPGHCRGHVVYHCPEEGFVINGDVLFSGSFGRVDLPGGDLETLKRSIFETMFALPEETVVYCGHGPETTIGQEKRFNYIHNF